MLEIELKRIADALEIIASTVKSAPQKPVPPAPAAAAPEAPKPVASVPPAPASIFDAPPAPSVTAPVLEAVTKEQLKKACEEKFVRLKHDAAPINRMFKDHFGVTGYGELDPSQYPEVLRLLEAL